MKVLRPDQEAFMLGLYLSGATTPEGDWRTHREIAHFINAAYEVFGINRTVSWQRIWQIEEKGIRRLRVKFRFHKDPVLRDMVEELFKI